MTKRHVLVIDDDFEMMQNDLERGLEKYGFSISGEIDRLEAMKRVKQETPDVVLLDIYFPDGMTGKFTLEEIKKKYSDLPVIMFTSTMADEVYNADDYLLSDFRYAKEALAKGDFSDLALKMNKIIENNASKMIEDDESDLNQFGFIVGNTKTMRELIQMIEKVADIDTTVLITGESGTGKELIAQSIHNLSKRRDKAFIPIVCAALAKELLESELFGHEKGAFTGATSQKKGKFEIAGGGIIFLDEIGEMPLDTQVKLLRFLQEKKFERVGGNIPLTSNARIIAATNQNPEQRIEEKKFRVDLFYRINAVRINVPPLRERIEDIHLLFKHFIEKANESTSKSVLPILREDVKRRLTAYDWPGNIRELENAIERAVALADENILQVRNFGNLGKERIQTSNFPKEVPDIVDAIYDRELTWQEIMEEFGKKSSKRKEVIMSVINEGYNRYGRRPTQNELAEVLSTTRNNIAQILSGLGIELTKMPKYK